MLWYSELCMLERKCDQLIQLDDCYQPLYLTVLKSRFHLYKIDWKHTSSDQPSPVWISNKPQPAPLFALRAIKI